MKRRTGVTAGANASAAIVGVVLMLTLAAETRNVWLQVAGCGLIGLLVVSWFSVLFDRGCDVTMDHPGDLVVGVPAEVSFTVKNRRMRRSRAMVIRYSLASARELVPETTVYVDPVAAGDTVELRATIVPSARGEATNGSWSVERLGAFGLFSARHVRATNRRVLVAPPAVAPLGVTFGEGSSDGTGRIRPGLDVRGAREWRPGDAVRHVHWRSTARTGRLTVLERGEQARAMLGVLVVGTGGEPQFEELVAVAAATVGHAIEDGAECYAWLEQEGVGCVGQLRRESFLVPFIRAESPVFPTKKGFDHLLEHVGAGATLLLVAAADVSPAWRADVDAAAAAAGLTVVDLARVEHPHASSGAIR